MLSPSPQMRSAEGPAPNGSPSTSATKGPVYSHALPNDAVPFGLHFSTLLWGGDTNLTILEFGLLALMFAADAGLPPETMAVKGSMTLCQVALLLLVKSIVTRLYNSYLEAVYFSFPEYRTQPPREHALTASAKDLMGRDADQLELLNWHNRITLITQFLLNAALFFLIPGYYPAEDAQPVSSVPVRAGRLVANHFVMSFGMYWMHRWFHTNRFLWDRIHSIHHYAKHPLSRNTYEDHWLDNFGAAIFGHFFAQVLVPLDFVTFWFSHVFRIFESLEEHSGVSCHLNLAYSAQRFFPFAQMPHHHDYHHEGFKGSNYTFTSIGGVWDAAFGTRKVGRAIAGSAVLKNAGTAADRAGDHRGKSRLDGNFPAVPLAALAVAVVHKLALSGGVVVQGTWPLA